MQNMVEVLNNRISDNKFKKIKKATQKIEKGALAFGVGA